MDGINADNAFSVSDCAARPAKNALTKTVRTGGTSSADTCACNPSRYVADPNPHTGAGGFPG